ncbi:alpha/beta fold hydrolase [Nocardia takedensis]|uniref:alpha/beta fold hydrolase n=1 Tax=Nocardia takedensis TaxID=259390 RepID=UPI00030723B7|nr:alpha/beta hydrolase [Nocardia takedensis]
MTVTLSTSAVDIAGATITYDLRPAGTPSARPPLFLLGSPMEAAAFATLAGHFPDRMVLTYDPRGTGRSPQRDPLAACSPTLHAADLDAVLTAADIGAVDVFATSGGAVNALAWIARHRPAVRTLVAHEPPATQFLPDRDVLEAAVTEIADTYRDAGQGPAMAKFIALVSQEGPLPAAYLATPGPDPAAFGLPTEDDGSRTHPLLGLNMRTCTSHPHDLDALRAASTRVVLVSGAASGHQFAARASEALAAAGGFAHEVVPGDHTGFVGGAPGQQDDSDAFAAALRRILDER